MRILITGAAGMFGRDSAPYFAGLGHDVVGADLNPAADSAIVNLDITSFDNVRETFQQVKPDLVLHAAAYTNVDGCERDPDTAFRANGYGTWVVATAAEEIGAALVSISTDFVFDGRKGAPYTEFDNPNPISHYGASKLAGEEAALRQCSRTYVVRTSWLYGIHGNPFPFAIYRRAREQGKLDVVADQTGTPTYTKDLAAAISRIVEQPYYGIYHASNDGETTWFEFARIVLNKAGLENVPVHPLTSAECAVKFNTPTQRPAYSVLRNYALELRGDEPMRPWTEALDDFIAEAKAAGKIE